MFNENTTNIFGQGTLYYPEDIVGTCYIECCACMSVYAEGLSWVHANPNRIVNKDGNPDNVILLSCQVTDLAVLNDLKICENLKKNYPNSFIFVGGCLARRFDIKLPKGVHRLADFRVDYQPLWNYPNNKLGRKVVWAFPPVHYHNPFWVNEFATDYNKNSNNISSGHLFRYHYPLRCSVGCHGKCQYCTIRHTRGIPYTLDIDRITKEFEIFDNILITADSPSVDILKQLINLSIQYNKPISIRNIEPQTAITIKKELLDLAQKRLLSIFHMPIQAMHEPTLTSMHRNAAVTLQAIYELVNPMKSFFNVITATNIIIDYPGGRSDELQQVQDTGYFDYISWNPYWDGKWNREQAEERFKKYID